MSEGRDWRIVCISIICVTVIVVVGVLTGHNGSVMMGGLAIVGGLGGFAVGKVLNR